MSTNNSSNNNEVDVLDDGPSPRGTKKGRKAGAKNWTEFETDQLLDVVEQVLPTGSKQWEKVALFLLQQYGKNRAALACSRRFNRLASVEKPTGCAEVPRLVQRAKDIKEAIDATEVIGFVRHNDSSDDTDDESIMSVGKNLPGTNLVDKNGNMRRPETKKRRTENLQDAITSLGEQQIESANVMAAAMMNMANKLCSGFGNDPQNATALMDNALKAKVDGIDAKVNGIEAKVDGIENKLNAILAYFAR